MYVFLCRVDRHGVCMAQHTAVFLRSAVYDSDNDICTVFMLREINFPTDVLLGFFVPDCKENLLQIVHRIAFNAHVHIAPCTDFG